MKFSVSEVNGSFATDYSKVPHIDQFAILLVYLCGETLVHFYIALSLHTRLPFQ